MDPAIIDYLYIAVVGLAATSVGFAIAWLRARERAIRAETHVDASLGRVTSDAETRFTQLDQAIDAVGVEVERLSEAERFRSQLLASRPERSETGP